MKPFKIRLRYSMHSFSLLKEKGEEIFTLEEAVAEANEHYPSWTEVYNGIEGAVNENVSNRRKTWPNSE